MDYKITEEQDLLLKMWKQETKWYNRQLFSTREIVERVYKTGWYNNYDRDILNILRDSWLQYCPPN